MKGEIMSLAEKLIEQGMQKGLREGELKGKLEIAERMLAEGSGFRGATELPTNLRIKSLNK